jgi:hypothetical protein
MYKAYIPLDVMVDGRVSMEDTPDPFGQVFLCQFVRTIFFNSISYFFILF